MKLFKTFGVVLIAFISLNISAQTADEIVSTYIENIGGADAWNAVESFKITGVGKQGGSEYPFVATFMKDGRSNITVDMPGSSFTYEAFDGETAWSTNMQSQKAEAFESEASTNYKNEAKDNVEVFVNYKEKGYSVELVGKDTWEGTEVYKIKLTKKPMLVEGKMEENTETYYFDTENMVPIASESVIKSGPAQGVIAQNIMSDYLEIDNGLILAHTIVQKFNGQIGLEMVYKTIELNGEIDETIFTMPKD